STVAAPYRVRSDRPGRRSSVLADALRGALMHVTEHVPGDPAHLDLLRTLGDPVAAMVPVDVLERLVPGVTEPAMHLQGPGGRLAAQPDRLGAAHRHPIRPAVH